jgi:hypothetical protein
LGVPAAAGAVSGSTLYVGGVFTSAGGMAGPNLGKWTGSAWTAFTGPNGPVFATAVAANGDLYVGGSFTRVGTTSANNIARFASPVMLSERH